MSEAVLGEIDLEEASRDEIVEYIQSLEDYVEQLADQFDEKAKSFDERLQRLEDQPTVEFPGRQIPQLSIDDVPVGKGIENRDLEIAELRERVEDIEKGEVDPERVVIDLAAAEDVERIPLHQMYTVAREVDHHDHGLSNNQEIAARTFPHLAKYAHPHQGDLLLPSTKLRDVIDSEIKTPELKRRLDVDDPHFQTVKRVMEFIEQFSDGLVEIDKDAHPKTLVIDEQAWSEYIDHVADAVGFGHREVTG